jgi:hypothetical protein
MSKSSDAVKRWRKNTKLKVIQSMGGHCQICKYSKCPEALDLHHIDPTKKEISFGRVTANPKAWNTTIVPELKKCILLCANCHREFHAGYVELPEVFSIFDESLITSEINNEMFDLCPVCNNTKAVINNYCSVKCGAKGTNNLDNKIVIDGEKLTQMVVDGCKRKDMAIFFSCSGETVLRRMKELGISQTRKKIIWPPLEVIQEKLWNMSIVDISKDIDVSYEAVRLFIHRKKLYVPTKLERDAHTLGIEPSSTV